jgi:ribosomal protein L11 methyltransferase
MYTQFTVSRENIEEIDVFTYNISQLPITGIEETEEEILFYAKGEEDTLICQQYIITQSIVCKENLLPETNWNALWESNFPPVSISRFVHIRADFHPSLQSDFEYEITINPKMSFGTGHHATTQSVIALMQAENFKGKTVLDFGSGTGILAILASMQGAANVDACDNDNWCIENSIENVARNNLTNINVFNGSTPLPNKTYDIVIANVNRHILLNNGVALSSAVKANGILIISGILDTDLPEMSAYFIAANFKVLDQRILNNWAGISFIKA